ncbi:MAG: ABC transporter permease, partial [Burkholderiales bacterium]
MEREKEEVREARWVRLLDEVATDVGYALRGLAKRPGFAAAAVLTLALGVGANTAIFGVVDALFLRYPAGVRNGEELVRLYIVRDERNIQTPQGGPGSYADFRAVGDRVRAFTAAAAFLYAQDVDLDRGEPAQRVRGRAVSQGFFPLLGIEAAAGRLFLPQEDSIAGAHPVAVISHGFWRRHFGDALGAVGSALLLNGQMVTVVGVAQEGFTGIDAEAVEVWLPMAMAGALGLSGEGTEDWRLNPLTVAVHVIGRLAPGATAATAEAQATTALRHAAEAVPELDPTPEVITGTLVPAGAPHRSMAASLALWLLLVTGMVLVIACANLAN